MTTFLTEAQLTNYRTCMACTERVHRDDGEDYILGFVCNDCDENHRERVVPIAELAEVFRDWAVEREVTFSTVTLDEFCGVDCADCDEYGDCADCDD